MTWTPDRWDSFCLLVDEGWPGNFDASAAGAWRTLLDPFDPADVVAALRRLVAKGGTFRPSVAELVGEIGADPSRPSFDEAVQMIFGPGGVLRAQPRRDVRWTSEAQRIALCDRAGVERAEQLHPLVAGFVRAKTIRGLHRINLEDPDWGAKQRADLRREFEDFAARFDERRAAALAVGADPAKGLAKFDPLAALGVDGPAQITQGDTAA